MDFDLRQTALDAINTKGPLTDKEKSNQPYLPELDAFLKVTFSAHIDSDFRRAVKFHGRSWNQVKKRCKKNTPALLKSTTSRFMAGRWKMLSG